MKTTTVTIGIPSYNGSQSIRLLLQSILKQHCRSFRLRKILVTVDGSSDSTGDIVRALQKKNPIISLKVHKTRAGKTARLNELYQSNTSDYLLTLDDDIVLGTDTEIETVLARARQTGAQVVAAHQIPCPSRGFVGRILYANHCLWTEARVHINRGKYIQNLQGSATLLRREFAKQLHYPVGIPCDQKYLYIKATRSHTFAFSPKNLVMYQPLGTIRDWLRLNQRISSEDHWLHESFGEHVPELYNPARQDILRAMTAQIKKDPFFTVLAIGMCYLFRIIMPFQKPTVTGFWPTLTSTKAPIVLNTKTHKQKFFLFVPLVHSTASSASLRLYTYSLHTAHFLLSTHHLVGRMVGRL